MTLMARKCPLKGKITSRKVQAARWALAMRDCTFF